MLTVKFEVMLKPTVELFCVIPVTFDPILELVPPPIDKVPDPALEFVIVPL